MFGTLSIEKSEMLSGLLKNKGIPHVVLDALRGDPPGPLAAWGRHRPSDELTPLADLIHPEVR